jgi:hypothetical protein
MAPSVGPAPPIVTVVNQFGQNTLDLYSAAALCVPSLKLDWSSTTFPTTTTTTTTSTTTTTTLFPPCGVTTKCVFLTSGYWTGNLGGLTGADEKCQTAAENGMPVLHGKVFKAWISDSVTSAADRLTHSTVPYARVDGVLVAMNWTGLTTSYPDWPINIDENGNWQPDIPGAWTNTIPDGTLRFTEYTCSDWTADTTGWATVGFPNVSRSGEWTRGQDYGCNEPASLYCFEQ